jgi:hypothetical protein
MKYLLAALFMLLTFFGYSQKLDNRVVGKAADVVLTSGFDPVYTIECNFVSQHGWDALDLTEDMEYAVQYLNETYYFDITQINYLGGNQVELELLRDGADPFLFFPSTDAHIVWPTNYKGLYLLDANLSPNEKEAAFNHNMINIDSIPRILSYYFQAPNEVVLETDIDTFTVPITISPIDSTKAFIQNDTVNLVFYDINGDSVTIQYPVTADNWGTQSALTDGNFILGSGVIGDTIRLDSQKVVDLVQSVSTDSLLQQIVDSIGAQIDSFLFIVKDSLGQTDTVYFVDTTGTVLYQGDNLTYVNGDKIGVSGFAKRNTFLVDSTNSYLLYQFGWLQQVFGANFLQFDAQNSIRTEFGFQYILSDTAGINALNFYNTDTTLFRSKNGVIFDVFLPSANLDTVLGVDPITDMLVKVPITQEDTNGIFSAVNQGRLAAIDTVTFAGDFLFTGNGTFGSYTQSTSHAVYSSFDGLGLGGTFGTNETFRGILSDGTLVNYGGTTSGILGNYLYEIYSPSTGNWSRTISDGSGSLVFSVNPTTQTYSISPTSGWASHQQYGYSMPVDVPTNPANQYVWRVNGSGSLVGDGWFNLDSVLNLGVQYSDSLVTFVTPDQLSDSLPIYNGIFSANNNAGSVAVDTTLIPSTWVWQIDNGVKFEDPSGSGTIFNFGGEAFVSQVNDTFDLRNFYAVRRGNVGLFIGNDSTVRLTAEGKNPLIGPSSTDYKLPAERPSAYGLPAGEYVPRVLQSGDTTGFGWLNVADIQGSGGTTISQLDTVVQPSFNFAVSGDFVPVRYDTLTDEWVKAFATDNNLPDAYAVEQISSDTVVIQYYGSTDIVLSGYRPGEYIYLDAAGNLTDQATLQGYLVIAGFVREDSTVHLKDYLAPKLDTTFDAGNFVQYADSNDIYVTPQQLSDSLPNLDPYVLYSDSNTTFVSIWQLEDSLATIDPADGNGLFDGTNTGGTITATSGVLAGAGFEFTGTVGSKYEFNQTRWDFTTVTGTDSSLFYSTPTLAAIYTSDGTNNFTFNSSGGTASLFASNGLTIQNNTFPEGTATNAGKAAGNYVMSWAQDGTFNDFINLDSLGGLDSTPTDGNGIFSLQTSDTARTGTVYQRSDFVWNALTNDYKVEGNNSVLGVNSDIILNADNNLDFDAGNVATLTVTDSLITSAAWITQSATLNQAISAGATLLLTETATDLGININTSGVYTYDGGTAVQIPTALPAQDSSLWYTNISGGHGYLRFDALGYVLYSDSLTTFVTPTQLSDSLPDLTPYVLYSDSNTTFVSIWQLEDSLATIVEENGMFDVANQADTFAVDTAFMSDLVLRWGDDTRLALSSTDSALFDLQGVGYSAIRLFNSGTLSGRIALDGDELAFYGGGSSVKWFNSSGQALANLSTNNSAGTFRINSYATDKSGTHERIATFDGSGIMRTVDWGWGLTVGNDSLQVDSADIKTLLGAVGGDGNGLFDASNQSANWEVTQVTATTLGIDFTGAGGDDEMTMSADSFSVIYEDGSNRSRLSWTPSVARVDMQNSDYVIDISDNGVYSLDATGVGTNSTELEYRANLMLLRSNSGSGSFQINANPLTETADIGGTTTWSTVRLQGNTLPFGTPSDALLGAGTYFMVFDETGARSGTDGWALFEDWINPTELSDSLDLYVMYSDSNTIFTTPGQVSDSIANFITYDDTTTLVTTITQLNDSLLNYVLYSDSNTIYVTPKQLSDSLPDLDLYVLYGDSNDIYVTPQQLSDSLDGNGIFDATNDGATVAIASAVVSGDFTLNGSGGITEIENDTVKLDASYVDLENTGRYYGTFTTGSGTGTHLHNGAQFNITQLTAAPALGSFQFLADANTKWVDLSTNGDWNGIRLESNELPTGTPTSLGYGATSDGYVWAVNADGTKANTNGFVNLDDYLTTEKNGIFDSANDGDAVDISEAILNNDLLFRGNSSGGNSFIITSTRSSIPTSITRGFESYAEKLGGDTAIAKMYSYSAGGSGDEDVYFQGDAGSGGEVFFEAIRGDMYVRNLDGKINISPTDSLILYGNEMPRGTPGDNGLPDKSGDEYVIVVNGLGQRGDDRATLGFYDLDDLINGPDSDGMFDDNDGQTWQTDLVNIKSTDELIIRNNDLTSRLVMQNRDVNPTNSAEYAVEAWRTVNADTAYAYVRAIGASNSFGNFNTVTFEGNPNTDGANDGGNVYFRATEGNGHLEALAGSLTLFAFDTLFMQTPAVNAATASNNQVLTLIDAATGEAEWRDATGGGGSGTVKVGVQEIGFGTSDSTLISDPLFTYTESATAGDGVLLVNTSSPFAGFAKFAIQLSDQGFFDIDETTAHKYNFGNIPNYSLTRGNGTLAAKTNTLDGDILGYLNWYSYIGATSRKVGHARVIADSFPTGLTDRKTGKMVFSVQGNDGVGIDDILSLEGDGYVRLSQYLTGNKTRVNGSSHNLAVDDDGYLTVVPLAAATFDTSIYTIDAVLTGDRTLDLNANDLYYRGNFAGDTVTAAFLPTGDVYFGDINTSSTATKLIWDYSGSNLMAGRITTTNATNTLAYQYNAVFGNSVQTKGNYNLIGGQGISAYGDGNILGGNSVIAGNSANPGAGDFNIITGSAVQLDDNAQFAYNIMSGLSTTDAGRTGNMTSNIFASIANEFTNSGTINSLISSLQNATWGVTAQSGRGMITGFDLEINEQYQYSIGVFNGEFTYQDTTEILRMPIGTFTQSMGVLGYSTHENNSTFNIRNSFILGSAHRYPTTELRTSFLFGPNIDASTAGATLNNIVVFNGISTVQKVNFSDDFDITPDEGNKFYAAYTNGFILGTSSTASGEITGGLGILSTGQLWGTDYGEGTFTDTAAYNLAVDSSGLIIEEDLSVQTPAIVEHGFTDTVTVDLGFKSLGTHQIDIVDFTNIVVKIINGANGGRYLIHLYDAGGNSSSPTTVNFNSGVLGTDGSAPSTIISTSGGLWLDAYYDGTNYFVEL